MPTTAARPQKPSPTPASRACSDCPGGEILVLIDELRRAGVDFVLMRHEANAGIAGRVRKTAWTAGYRPDHARPRALPTYAALSSAFLIRNRCSRSRANPDGVSRTATRINCCRFVETYSPLLPVRRHDHWPECRRGRRTRARRMYAAAVRTGVFDSVGPGSGQGYGRIARSAGLQACRRGSSPKGLRYDY
jgi:hypothetical protein